MKRDGRMKERERKAKNVQRTGKKRKVNAGRGLYMYKRRVTEERPSVTMKRDGLKTCNEERSVYDRAKGRVGGKEALEGVRKLENCKVEGGGLERRWKRGWSWKRETWKAGNSRRRKGEEGRKARSCWRRCVCPDARNEGIEQSAARSLIHALRNDCRASVCC